MQCYREQVGYSCISYETVDVQARPVSLLPSLCIADKMGVRSLAVDIVEQPIESECVSLLQVSQSCKHRFSHG